VRLHVLTAVSRPENLPAIAESLAVAAANAADVEVVWQWRFDTERRCIGGQAVKNAMLDSLGDDYPGWVWILDDDTLAHPDVLAVVSEAADVDTQTVIVSQRRTDGRILPAVVEHMCPGGVDIGQAFLRRDLIGAHRIPEDYNGDGMFLASVLIGALVVFLPDVVSLHNALSGVEVSA
jgi:hypothetical protein